MFSDDKAGKKIYCVFNIAAVTLTFLSFPPTICAAHFMSLNMIKILFQWKKYKNEKVPLVLCDVTGAMQVLLARAIQLKVILPAICDW